MSQKIQVRRGTDAARTSVVLDLGEPAFTSDTKRLYVGDGVTPGGILAGGGAGVNIEGDSFVAFIPASGGSFLVNGSGLMSAINYASTKRPHGFALSSLNRFTVLVYPGFYQLPNGTNLNTTRYVDIVGVGSAIEATLFTANSEGFILSSGYCNIENLNIYGPNRGFTLNANGQVISDLSIKNCVIEGTNASIANISPLSNCVFDNVSNVGPGCFMASPDYVDTHPMTGCTFIRCFTHVNSAQNFLGSPISYSKNNLLKDCTFYGGSSFINLGFGFDYTNLMTNCRILGYGCFDETSAYVPGGMRIENCYIETNINGFHGSINNSTIDARYEEFGAPAITVSNLVTGFLCVTNSRLLSSPGLPSVTGETVTSSGFFANCVFNNPVATGVTGRFGNQGNLVSSYVK